MTSDWNIILSACPIPMLVVGADERVAAENGASRRLLGHSVLARHYITVLRQPALLDAIERVLSGAVESAEARYLSWDAGRETTHAVTAGRLGRGESGGVLLTFLDITDRQQAETMRRDFVANVSHELRTPLTALMGFIETLRGAARDDAAARERFLSIMAAEAGRMNRLVRDLLSLSQVEAVQRVRPEGRVDIAALVRSTVQTLRPIAEAAEPSLVARGAEEPALVRGDADQLAQVLSNLVENALKYGTGARGIVITVEHVAAEPTIRGPAVLVTVADDGEGIDPVHIPRLTERFYRVDTHRSRKLGGTGLGLAIVKHIVDRHRGRLRIEFGSRPRKPLHRGPAGMGRRRGRRGPAVTGSLSSGCYRAVTKPKRAARRSSGDGARGACPDSRE